MVLTKTKIQPRGTKDMQNYVLLYTRVQQNRCTSAGVVILRKTTIERPCPFILLRVTTVLISKNITLLYDYNRH
jgi:hypothetical protein